MSAWAAAISLAEASSTAYARIVSRSRYRVRWCRAEPPRPTTYPPAGPAPQVTCRGRRRRRRRHRIRRRTPPGFETRPARRDRAGCSSTDRGSNAAVVRRCRPPRPAQFTQVSVKTGDDLVRRHDADSRGCQLNSERKMVNPGTDIEDGGFESSSGTSSGFRSLARSRKRRYACSG